MSIHALKNKEMPHVQEWARAYSVPALCQAWLAPGILLITFPVLGSGLLSQASTAFHASGVDIEITYEPVAHLHKPITVSLSVMNIFGSVGQFSIRAGQELSDNFSVLQINPRPISVRVNQGVTLYLFSAKNTNIIAFTLTPKLVGETAATFQYDLDPPVAFSVNTLPW